MGRPYNKKTVEEAALLAETLASNPHLGDMQWVALFLGIRESSTAFTLAEHAFYAVNACVTDLTYAEVWNEAAALIAEGWQIGDEVALLNHVDGTAYAEGSFVEGEPVIERTLVSVPLSDDAPVTSLAEAPMSGEMKFKACAMLQAMTATPIETETPVVGGANVMDENGLEPPEPSYNPGDNFFAQDDDGE